MFGKSNASRPRLHPLKFVVYIFFFIAFLLAIGWLVMFLWNSILPEVTSVKRLTYWQAVGLLLLSKILFGSFRKPAPWSKKKEHWRKRWNNMSDAERQDIKDRWKKRCEHRRKKEE